MTITLLTVAQLSSWPGLNTVALLRLLSAPAAPFAATLPRLPLLQLPPLSCRPIRSTLTGVSHPARRLPTCAGLLIGHIQPALREGTAAASSKAIHTAARPDNSCDGGTGQPRCPGLAARAPTAPYIYAYIHFMQLYMARGQPRCPRLSGSGAWGALAFHPVLPTTAHFKYTS